VVDETTDLGDVPYSDVVFVVDDTAPASDVVLMIKLIDEVESTKLSGYNLPGKLNSEVEMGDLKGKLTVMIYYKEARIIVGDQSPAEQVILAVDIVSILKTGFGINPGQAILSSKVKSDDLTKLFGGMFVSDESMVEEAEDVFVRPDEPVTEPSERPDPVVIIETVEPDCNGCKTDSTCLPFGTRLVEDGVAKYCSIDKELKPQVTGGVCQNNYECSANVCADGECLQPGLIKKIIGWFMKLFG